MALVPTVFVGAAIGDVMGKELCNQAGIDVAFGIIAFAFSPIGYRVRYRRGPARTNGQQPSRKSFHF